MKVRDYRGAGTARAAFVLHEKGGKHPPIPAHHRAADYVDAYLALANLHDTPDAPLWQSIPRRSTALSGRALRERNALDIIKRRCGGRHGPACGRCYRSRLARSPGTGWRRGGTAT